MSILDSIRKFFVPTQRQPYPPVIFSRALPSGRVSRDSDDSFAFNTWVFAPPASYEQNYCLVNIDARLLDRYTPTKLMEMLADFSPEVSRALWDFLRLCNPGWEVEALKPGGDTFDKRAQQATTDFLKSLSGRHGTVDIVFGRLFMAAFLRGAFCCELVLNRRGRVPLDLATPDPASIRFRKRSDPELGEVWQPGQWQAYNFKELDIPTFRYVPIDPALGSPYGRPMAAPALFTSLFLLGMLHDLKRVIQQQGYPRLDLSINTMQMAEKLEGMFTTPESWQAFTDKLMSEVTSAFSQLQPDDTYIHSDAVTMNRPVGTVDASSLAGIDAIIKMLERMCVRALKTMPLMLGITENTGDVQSNRQWELFAAGIKSIQHYAETMLGHLLTLALEAQGMQANVVFRFAELRAAERLRDAQTEAMEIANEKSKYDQGWTEQDEGSERITGHKAVEPEPRRQAVAAPAIVQDDGDGNERVDESARWIAEVRAARLEVDRALERISTNGYH
jgi:hypothetical protein